MKQRHLTPDQQRNATTVDVQHPGKIIQAFLGGKLYCHLFAVTESGELWAQNQDGTDHSWELLPGPTPEDRNR